MAIFGNLRALGANIDKKDIGAKLNKGSKEDHSEEHELFSDVADDFVWDDFQNVETDGLAKGSAFTDDDDVTFLDWESWGAVDWDVSVSFFISIVFWDVVKVVSSDDDGSLHFGWDADTLEDSSSDWDVAGEWAFLINVGGFDGLLWSSESKSDVFKVSDTWSGLFGEKLFSIKEDCFLFLEWSFVLK